MFSYYFIYASYIVTIIVYCTSCCQCTWSERNKEWFDLIWFDLILVFPNHSHLLFMVWKQPNLGRRIGTSKMHLSPQWLRLLPILRRWLCCCWFIVYYCSYCLLGFCVYALICSFAIILTRKRDLVALLKLSSWWLVTVGAPWLLLAVPWVGLQCVIVVFSDQMHLRFCSKPRPGQGYLHHNINIIQCLDSSISE